MKIRRAFDIQKRMFSWAVVMTGLWCATHSWAQQTTLYDPMPPANSAYVRVIWGGATGAYEVSLDGKVRLSGVQSGTPSDYMIVPAGKHEVQLKLGQVVHKVPVEAEASRSITVVLTDDVKSL